MRRELIADLLERAVEVGDRDGWVQGAYHIRDIEEAELWGTDERAIGGRCAVGCIWQAREEVRGVGPVTMDEAIQFLADAIGFEGPYRKGHWVNTWEDAVTCWNDEDGREWGEVRDKMLAAAKEIRNDLRASGARHRG